jgi:hypothetical protein
LSDGAAVERDVPVEARIHALLGWRAVAEGDGAEAERCARIALRSDPDAAPLLRLLAEAQRLQGR